MIPQKLSGFSCLFLLFVSVLYEAVADSPCENVLRTPAVVADSDDCTTFHICIVGRELTMSCGPSSGNKVFDPKSKNCVRKGSQFDNSACNAVNTPCPSGVYGRRADETNCARFYQCADGEAVQHECHYPRLYNRNSKRCEPFMFVSCAKRHEPKDPCEYLENQCPTTGCVPCRSRFGSCIGLRDGPNLWKGKPWTPSFVICKNQRVVMHGDCTVKGRVQVFHPVLRECVAVVARKRRGKIVSLTMIDRRGRRYPMRMGSSRLRRRKPF